MARLARWPLLHFLVLGGLLFLARESATPEAPVVVPASRVAELRGDFARQHGRAPSADEDRRLLDQLMEEELLLHEARRLGLDRGDLVIFRRLTDKMRTLADDPERPVAELYRQALELGLDRDDVIVRQRLMQKLAFRMQAGDGPVRATPAEIEGYYQRHLDRFVEPARVRLTHVFLGDASASAAARLLEALRREGVSPEDAPSRGDVFLLGHHLPPRTRAALERGFGEHFAARAFALEPGTWGGVAESPYGLHLVWVHEHRPAAPAELETVREKVLRGIAEERQRERREVALASLRQRYDIVFEEVG